MVIDISFYLICYFIYKEVFEIYYPVTAEDAGLAKYKAVLILHREKQESRL